MPVGVGPRQLGGGLGAVDRGGGDLQVAQEHGDVEAAEVEYLQHAGIGEDALEVRTVVGRSAQPHHVGVAVSGRQLDHAERIAPEAQAHGLRIDGDRIAEAQAVGQVAFMQVVGQVR